MASTTRESPPGDRAASSHVPVPYQSPTGGSKEQEDGPRDLTLLGMKAVTKPHFTHTDIFFFLLRDSVASSPTQHCSRN